MAKYSIGQIVQLNSGGPKMTIVNVLEEENIPQVWKYAFSRLKAENPNGKVWYQTQWFEGNELKKNVFLEEVLSIYQE